MSKTRLSEATVQFRVSEKKTFHFPVNSARGHSCDLFFQGPSASESFERRRCLLKIPILGPPSILLIQCLREWDGKWPFSFLFHFFYFFGNGHFQ